MRSIIFSTLFIIAFAQTASAQFKSPKLAASPFAVFLPVKKAPNAPLIPQSTCWDTNGDGSCQGAEDYDQNGVCDWSDCRAEVLDWMADGPCLDMADDAECAPPTGFFTPLYLTSVGVEGVTSAVDVAIEAIIDLLPAGVHVYDHSVASQDMRQFAVDVLSISYYASDQALAKHMSDFLQNPVSTPVVVQCFSAPTGAVISVQGPNSTGTPYILHLTNTQLAGPQGKIKAWIATAVDTVR